MLNRCKRQAWAVLTLLFVCYFFLVSNLFFLQIRHVHCLTPFNVPLQGSLLVLPEADRGIIIDRHGVPLAINVPEISAYIDCSRLKNRKQTVAFLAEYFPDACRRLSDNKNKQCIVIARRLSADQQQCIVCAQVPDIKLSVGVGRYYPMPATSTVIGVVGVDNAGLSGIEYKKQYFLTSNVLPGVDNQVQLTIDAELQFLVQEELRATLDKFKAREGTAIIMNPENGEVLAMVSLPSFDPNDGKKREVNHMSNKVVTDGYEPGSVMKVFAALAALQEGMVTVDELIDCGSSKSVVIEGRTINTCVAHGIIPFIQVIAGSNNIGIAQVAKRLGHKLYDHYLRIGFGKKTEIDFPGERSGFVNPPEYWSKQSIISLSYGYEIVVTPLQLAVAFSVIANGGYRVKPQLTILSKGQFGLQQRSEKLYSDQALAAIEHILAQTALRSTARLSKLAGFSIKSKTGTANTIENGTYNVDKNIYTCAGIVQKNDYKRVMVVCVKHAEHKNLYASMVAAPLFERVAQVMVVHEKVN